MNEQELLNYLRELHADMWSPPIGRAHVRPIEEVGASGKFPLAVACNDVLIAIELADQRVGEPQRVDPALARLAQP